MPSEYTYDREYGRKYSVSEIAELMSSDRFLGGLTEPEVELLTDNGHFELSKRTLVDFANTILSGPKPTEEGARKFAILVILWGYASQGYGLYRAGRILSEDTTNQLGKSTLAAYGALKNGDIRSAYKAFESGGKVRWVGESFFTKILFFCSKSINPVNPPALIKDARTSSAASKEFADGSVLDRSFEAYEIYLAHIDKAARVQNIGREQVEERLFSQGPRLASGDNEELIKYAFGYGRLFDAEYAPPALISDQENVFAEIAPTNEGVLRILLIADGKPQYGNLPPMTIGGTVRPLHRGFYSHQRAGLIQQGAAAAQLCHAGTGVYVLTTGFGAVPVSASINLYNVPGEISCGIPHYQALYKTSLGQIVQTNGIKKISIVYYAGRSRAPFRNMIFAILGALNAELAQQGYIVHACMYGSRQHPTGRFDNLCNIFDCLDAGASPECMNPLRTAWLAGAASTSPFFQYC